MPGIREQHVTLFGMEMPSTQLPMDRRTLYPQMFATWRGFWLTWAAMLLAVISTAHFPRFLTSAPSSFTSPAPSAAAALFTKYASGLLFVTLQALVFSLGGYLPLVCAPGMEALLFWPSPWWSASSATSSAFATHRPADTFNAFSGLLTLLFWLASSSSIPPTGVLVKHMEEARKIAFTQRALNAWIISRLPPFRRHDAVDAPGNAGRNVGGTAQTKPARARRSQAELQRLSKFERMAWWPKPFAQDRRNQSAHGSGHQIWHEQEMENPGFFPGHATPSPLPWPGPSLLRHVGRRSCTTRCSGSSAVR